MKILDVPQSGTTGTMVSYKTRYGQFRRRHVIPRDPRTASQVNWRLARRRVSPLWATLTDGQRTAWNILAEDRRTRKRLGQSGRVSGYLLFVKLNCHQAALGLPPISDASACPPFPPNPVVQLIITNTNGKIALKLKVSGKRAQYIIVLGAKPRSAGVTYVDDFTNLDVMPDPEGGLSDITDLFVKKYGVPRVGLKVFIQTVQQIDGWRDLPQQLSAIVPEA
jgi:hypothetical protein